MKVIRFLISGLCAAGVEYVSFILLQYATAEKSLILSQSASFLLGFVVSFSLNKLWVFKSTGNTKVELIKYLILLGINLVLTNIILSILVNQLNITFWISKIAVMAMVAVWNYFIFQKLIFANKEKKVI